MRFGVGRYDGRAATLLLAPARRRPRAARALGVLRPAPRPQVGRGVDRPRLAAISSPHFSSCFVVPASGSPVLGGGFPFVSIQIFASSPPSPDPTARAPDPGRSRSRSRARTARAGNPVPVAATPRNSVPALRPRFTVRRLQCAGVRRAAAVSMPRVSEEVVGDLIDDHFGLWASSFSRRGVVRPPSIVRQDHIVGEALPPVVCGGARRRRLLASRSRHRHSRLSVRSGRARTRREWTNLTASTLRRR